MCWCAAAATPHPAGQAYCRISAGMGRAQDATAAEPAADQTHSRAPGPGWWPSVPCAKKEHRGQVKRSKFPPTFKATERRRSETRERCAGSPWPTGTRLMLRMALRTNLPHAQGQICRLPRGSRVATRWHTRLDGRAPSSPTLAGWQGTADGKPLCAVCKSIRRAARSWCVFVLCVRAYGACARVPGVRSMLSHIGVCACYV